MPRPLRRAWWRRLLATCTQPSPRPLGRSRDRCMAGPTKRCSASSKPWTHLRTMSRDLGESSGNTKWFEISRRIEEFIVADRKLNANVDFYSASTYHTLGIDIDLFTPVFAVSRVAGWTAHVIEQLNDNRLIRPRADYQGPVYPNKYVPMEKR